MAAGKRDVQPVVRNSIAGGNDRFEDLCGVAPRHLDVIAIGEANGDAVGTRLHRADDEAAALEVRTEKRKRIVLDRARQTASSRVRGTGGSLGFQVNHSSRVDSSGRSPGPPSDVTPAYW